MDEAMKNFINTITCLLAMLADSCFIYAQAYEYPFQGPVPSVLTGDVMNSLRVRHHVI